MTNIGLVISLTFLIFMIISMNKNKKKKKNEITYKMLYLIITFLAFYGICMLSQSIFGNIFDLKLVYYEYATGLAAEYIPVFVTLLGMAYNNKLKNIKKTGIILSIFPTIALFTLWTNDIHHLFYINYSTRFIENVGGPMFIANAMYSYILFFTGIVNIVVASLRRSGFFSIQTAFVFLGCSVTPIVNVLGATKILSLTVYTTPILFTFTALCFYIAIFKLNAFDIIPVASRTVMDTMSDGYVVISEDGTIAGSNKTFREKFNNEFEFEKDVTNLFTILDSSELIDLSELKKLIEETRKTGEIATQEYHFNNEKIDKYFEVDIHPISARDNKKDYIATLLVFKDITQHKLDILEIEEKRDIIVKQQQLVSIGELAGGVAHDINTPISAIKTGITMLNSMSENRPDAEKEILDRMDNCASKIINIVNSMRNQIRNLGGNTNVVFKISGVINDVKTLTYHEVMKNKSEVVVDINDDVEIKGDPTKLGQVLTNLIVNAAQAYDENGGKINIMVSKVANKYVLINVIDYAGGMNEEIVPYVFKNILTTKGTSGTGLGLYLAYSVIKGEFNGEIDFNTQKGEGTTFTIRIPLYKEEPQK